MVRSLVLLGLGALLAATLALARDPAEATSSASPLRVTLRRDPCFGACPTYTVTIRGDGRVVYVGRRYVSVPGVRRARLSAAAVRRLRAQVAKARVFALASRYDRSLVSDLPSARLTVRVGGRTKRIYHYFGDRRAPSRLWKLECFVDELARTSRWVGHRTADLCRAPARRARVAQPATRSR